MRRSDNYCFFYATNVIREAYKMFGGEIKTGILDKIPTNKQTIESTQD